MFALPRRRAVAPDIWRGPWKLLLWAAITGLIFGLIAAGEIVEGPLRTIRDSFRWHKASGETVLVMIDNQSLKKVGRWPWPRRYHAELINRLSEAGAKRILYDVTFIGTTSPQDDQAFVEALKRSGRVTLPTRTLSGPNGWAKSETTPLPDFANAAAGLGTISWRYDFRQSVTEIPYSARADGKVIPSYSALLAGRRGELNQTYAPDYSVDPMSIPTLSATNVLDRRFDPKLVTGKNVVVGWTTEELGDQFFVPGTGRMGGAYVHIIGAETLKSGHPVRFGWVPLFLLAYALSVLALSRRDGRQQALILGGAAMTILFAPALPEAYNISLDVTPGLFVIAVVSSALAWRRYRVRGLVNMVSHLPNLNALRDCREGKKQSLIAARVLNYAEIVATLPPNSERQLVDQIVSRLAVGKPNRTLYQGDGGIFTWFEDSRTPVSNHLEALHALFRNPARVAGLSLDLAVAFGVEIGSGRSLSNRLASALVAAEEAAHDGLKWKYHDPDSLQVASWKLSILSELDAAIDRGEVWVAYQPKLDIASGRIVGAEALARWTHPEKGPIAASEFVAAAEQHNRIGKLTDFVLAQAVAAAAQFKKQSDDFDIAVNLSARLLTDKSFTLRVAALIARHGVEPKRLTLELTETAALADNGESLEMIMRLRELGIRISIDDYGTGMSTLEYLKKIPANEIKIDQSFVKGMVDNRSDRLMVQSTIGLAHSLGRKVVAEGVEQREILDLLAEMGCDIAQGFAVGRPMSLEGLAKRLTTDRRRSVA
jgi:EAL domain-containing protein (putative c-di-GMP-specific phosphodiesterase class I)/CHASE2 domain-containing sensor protein